MFKCLKKIEHPHFLELLYHLTLNFKVEKKIIQIYIYINIFTIKQVLMSQITNRKYSAIAKQYVMWNMCSFERGRRKSPKERQTFKP